MLLLPSPAANREKTREKDCLYLLSTGECCGLARNKAGLIRVTCVRSKDKPLNTALSENKREAKKKGAVSFYKASESSSFEVVAFLFLLIKLVRQAKKRR
jgi:hypothetical protein